MGVRFNRNYKDIIRDLTDALAEIDGCHEFFEMSVTEWSLLGPEEQRECLQTLADDLFYGLGAESFIEMGESMVTYHRQDHTIRISYPEKPLRVVQLI